VPEGANGVWPERRDPVLTTLAEEPNLIWSKQLQVAASDRQCFSDARTGIVEEEEKHVVAKAIARTLIGLAQDCPDLIWFEVARELDRRFLPRQRENTTVLI